MKAAYLVLGALARLAPAPAGAPLGPVPTERGAPGEVQAKPPSLLGETTAKAILANRTKFQDNLAKVQLSEDLRSRWKAVRRPVTLVAVFGSWCGDSHRQLPDLLALAAEPNPFIEVHYLGVARNKAVAAWPRGCPPQKVDRVPTFYLFATQPGGRQKLTGTVVETPPRAGQTMAMALVELLEASGRTP
jgi:thiol-disulfide isomerase/thioredoxin